MNCPHCTSPATKEQQKKTTLGYPTLRCSACRRLFNERTGTPFNSLEYPTDSVYGLGTSGLFQACDDAKEKKSSEPTLESLPQTPKGLLYHRHFLFKTERGQRTVSKHHLCEIAAVGVRSSELIRLHVTHADATDRCGLAHTSGV
jgi:hypothetical protein